MSDDLISRKAVLDILTEERIRNSILASPAFGEMLAQRIKNIPTAFDKEKVIEELDKLTGEECTLHECGIRSERCKPCIAKKAIEIVEKGGIECEKYYSEQSG